MDEKLDRFADWVWATCLLFADEWTDLKSTAFLSQLSIASVKREQVIAMRREGEWSIAVLREAEAMASPVSAVLYVGLSSFFHDEDEFELREYRYVRARLIKLACSG